MDRFIICKITDDCINQQVSSDNSVKYKKWNKKHQVIVVTVDFIKFVFQSYEINKIVKP